MNLCKSCGITGLGDTTYLDYPVPEGGGGSWGGVNTPPSYNNPSLWNAINTAISSASGILGARYAVPQLNPGQLIQTGPNGQSIMYQGTAGNMSLPSISSLTSGGGSMILLAGGALLLVMMLGKK